MRPLFQSSSSLSLSAQSSFLSSFPAGERDRHEQPANNYYVTRPPRIGLAWALTWPNTGRAQSVPSPEP